MEVKAGNDLWRVLSEPKIRDQRRAVIVADLRSDIPDQWERFLARCVLHNIPVIDYWSTLEMRSNRVKIENLYEHFMHSLNPSPIYLVVKGLIDRVLSALLLVLLFPIFIVIGLIIKIDTSGPVFFNQIRIGYRGRPFVMFKFRTMVHVRDPGWKTSTDEADPRITRAGRFLRRHRLDELPQLMNVLLGHMSLVGPRPEAVKLARYYAHRISFFKFRYVVKPGITGWAQVEQGFAAEIETMEQKLSYDFFYIKYFSPTLDALIFVKTIAVVLLGKGYR
ncbi:MAG: sugar transferase [Minwuia sp.]|uniref:sugar transferase n=1 Tax=Minwuia sp. TaxID=2493630 RepID=UPI003A8AC928